VPIALGTDTNGSIRSPAAHCGVVGFKPSRGALPSAGVAPLAPSQDTVGLIAAQVPALMAIWRVVAGGEFQPAAAPAAVARRVGFARAATATASEPVAHAVAQSVRRLAAAGIEVVEVELPDPKLVRAASLLVILREAADAWEGLVETEGDGLSAEVRATLRSAATVTRAAYQYAKRVRLQVCSALAPFDVDAILLPTVPITATLAGAERVELDGRMRSVEALQSEYTALASLTGQPAISLRCGEDQDGMPIGLQLLGKARADDQLLELGCRVEQAFV
jgi:Asp-tRNA(Asn)/Glu-tRNA(Gln) amidotransferase A subunit family amidase